MSLSKQARKRNFQESWEEKYFCYAQDDNVRCLLCSKVQKDTHKWNNKRHYDTCHKDHHTVIGKHVGLFLNFYSWILLSCCCCCLLFNDCHVLQLGQAISNHRWMIYDGYRITRDKCGPNFLTFIYGWEKTPEKTSTGKLTQLGIELGPMREK